MSLLPRIFVSAGDFRVSTVRGERLEAYLGTCVGVAIVDTKAGVGGLLHILLPDAVSAGLAYGAAICARTSLPRFLDELVVAGCSPDQYVASARPLFYREVIVRGAELLEVERTILGVSREEAGSRLAERWSFPSVLRDVVAHHTHPAEAEVHRTLAFLVHLADLLVSRFDAGHELDRLGTRDLVEVLRHLRIDVGSLPELIGRIRWRDLQTPGYA